MRVLQHVLGTLRSTTSCLPRLRNQLVAASFLESLCLGNDRRQLLSSEFVAQSAAKFGVVRNHTDALMTATGSWKGAVGECTPHAICSRRCNTTGNRLQRTIDQAEEYRPFLYTRYPFLPELSGNIILETSRNLQNLPDYFGIFHILLDHSFAQRSLPNGLIGTCADNDPPCVAVLARRLIGICTGLVQGAKLSQWLAVKIEWIGSQQRIKIGLVGRGATDSLHRKRLGGLLWRLCNQ